MDEVASKVILAHDEKYQSVTSTVALAVISFEFTRENGKRVVVKARDAINFPVSFALFSVTSSSSHQLGYLQRNNPHTDEFGFSSGQFEILRNISCVKNTSFVLLPQEAVNHAQGNLPCAFSY